jgi:hypothetical protein
LRLQLGDAVCRAAPIQERLRALPDSLAPRDLVSFARSVLRGPEPLGGVDPPGNIFTCWCYCSSRNPLGNSISMRIETILTPDSTRARFLSSRLIAQLLIRVCSGPGTTPARGAGEICLVVGDCSPSQGQVEPASTNLCPVARDYPSRAVDWVFQPFRARLMILSILHTGHHQVFQHSCVRTSMRYYPHFILPMCSSRGFASTAPNLVALSDSLSLRLRARGA